MGAVSLSNLKELIAAVSFRPREHLPSPDLRSGIPLGALSEVSGSGKTEFITRFLAANPGLRVAWVEDELSIYPNALLQRQVDLNRVLFVEAGGESYWTVLQALRSQIFGAVIYSSTTTERIGGRESARLPTERMQRSLQLAAEKSKSALILLTDEPSGAWPVSLQLRVSRERVSWAEETFPSLMLSSNLPLHGVGDLGVEVLRRR